MPSDRQGFRVPGIPRWVWFAVAAILAAIPIVMSIGVPATRPGAGGFSRPVDEGRGRPAVSATGTAAPLPTSAPPDSVAPVPEGVPAGAGDPDLGAAPPRSAYDVAYDALEAEMATLKVEKGAIEAEEARLRGKREELESFERDHPDGVPPELYSRYEDARATYNSDVQAFKSRAGAYQMKVAEIERRVEALRPATP